jgi:Flp pilus assembly pilin Flp
MFNRFNINPETGAAAQRASGQTMTEYALILAAIAIVAIVGYTTLGTTITTLVNNLIACL